MDATSSSLPFNTRDGSTSAAAAAVEDDTALSLAAGLAKEAALLFQAGKLQECRRVLIQLSQKKDDPKVRHNMIITENFQDGCSDPKKLLESLENIKNQIEELAQTSGECLEVNCEDDAKSTSSMKGTNIAADHLSRSSLVYSEKFDTSVVMFNIAVIWFHLDEYSKSFWYLDTLYQIIEPIDEGTALRICLLLLDVSLLSHRASKSADVITYMEKVFRVNSLVNQVDNGTLAQQSLLVPKSAPLPSNSTVHDPSQSDVITGNALENSLTRTLSEEALEDESLQLLSSLDISGQNLQRPGILSSSDPPRNQGEDDLRRKMHLYKVRFFLLTRNLKAAKREVKMAMNLARGKDYPMALFLKSQLEYARRNYRKAIKLLMASSNLTENGISSMYYNNLGCIYYQLGKYHTCGVFFSKAMKKCSAVRKERSSNLLTLSQDKSLLISYNCGMHSLACGRPFHAARCFRKASLIFFNRPLLWLRIAECCFMALEKGLILCNSPAAGRHDIGATVIGKGKWRELALRHESLANGRRKFIELDRFSGDDSKKHELSLPLARQCLVNALHLLDSSEPKDSRYGFPFITDESDPSVTLLSRSADNKTVAVGDHEEPNVASGLSQPNSNGEVKEHKGGNTQNASLQNSITEYDDIRMKENKMIKQAILADLAYVELSLGDPLKALSTAKSLLMLPECSRMYIFLGTTYIAEALCLLNRPTEAATHLMKYISNGNDVQVPFSQEDCEKWTVEKAIDNEDSNAGTIAPGVGLSSDKSQTIAYSSPEEARGVLCANYAANLALLGDIEQAKQFVTKALCSIPRSSQAILTSIYLDLKCGKTEDALAKLKQHSAVRFVRDSVTSLSG